MDKISSAPNYKGANMHEQQKQRIENQLLLAIDQYRSMIIDPVELLMGESPNWPSLRRQLLKAFGDRGLSARIKEILNNEYDKNWGEE
jgi:hypothetical protein